MLVLTRKCGESIVIAPSTVVTVVQVRGNRVRLGIEAPAEVRVLRARGRPPKPALAGPPRGKRQPRRA